MKLTKKEISIEEYAFNPSYAYSNVCKSNYELQERIDKVIKYIEKETEGRDANPIEGSWLYDLLKVLELLKGEKE